MSRFASNFGSGLLRAGIGIYNRLSPYTATPALRSLTTSTTGQSRLESNAYDVRDQILAGTVYRKSGGYLQDVLKALGKPCDVDTAPPITTYYNPVPAIVGAYANALGGRLGRELEPQTPDGEPLADPVDDALSRLWRWSNLDTRLGEMTTLAANQGSVGIRIVAGADRVYLDFDHPSNIYDAEEDSRGNVVNVLLKYTVYGSAALGQPPMPIEVEELIGKERHSVLIGGREQLDADQQINALGVCPFVILRHERRNGDFFGRHAYEGSENAIHGINWALSQLDDSIARAITETVFMAGAGDAPTEISLGRLTAMYVKLAAGVPAPELKYIVPQLAIGETRDTILANVELLWTRQPELILNALKLLSGTSGETLAQVLKPVEAAVLRARRMYEDATIRALQIGMSAGVLLGLWDLGTGTGAPDAADRAFDGGQGPEGFRFSDRPALPETPQARMVNAQADVADRKAKFELAAAASRAGVNDPKEIMMIAGYDNAEATRLATFQAPQAPAPASNGQQQPAGTVSPRVQRLLASLS